MYPKKAKQPVPTLNVLTTKSKGVKQIVFQIDLRSTHTTHSSDAIKGSKSVITPNVFSTCSQGIMDSNKSAITPNNLAIHL